MHAAPYTVRTTLRHCESQTNVCQTLFKLVVAANEAISLRLSSQQCDFATVEKSFVS
jgi:hypothetical protein